MSHILLSAAVHDRLAAIADSREVPISEVLEDMLAGWTPTADDAHRARVRDDVTVWIDAGVHERLRLAAERRGVTMRALVEEALTR